jgi:tight adherence protein B
MRIESQLADSIDLMVGALRAGAGLLAALEAALKEAGKPFRPYLAELTGRIRLGDDPVDTVRDLAGRVPLETFRLFSLSLAVHWEAGGSLASTLSAVGGTIRDRIETSRRIRAQAIEVQVSVAAIMAISYVTAILMFRANPQTLRQFMFSQIGSYIVSAAICLQAIGITWISRMSRVRY